MRRLVFNRVILLAAASTLGLAACDGSGSEESSSAVEASADYEAGADAAEEMAESVVDSAGATESAIPQLDDVQVSLPRLAYIYDFAFRLAGEDIGTLQRRHADLCEQQGPASCQIMGMSTDGAAEDGDVSGRLELAVATKHARAFGALLEKEAGTLDAEQVSAQISAEELSKQMVDTEARLEARVELRDRLLEVLRTRKGDVSELVEAERSVAQVNEEIDQAKSWLSEMQNRVAFSRMTVNYESADAPGGDFLRPVEGALGSVGAILGVAVAALVVMGAILLPVGLLVLAVRLATGRPALPRRREAEPEAA